MKSVRNVSVQTSGTVMRSAAGECIMAHAITTL